VAAVLDVRVLRSLGPGTDLPHLLYGLAGRVPAKDLAQQSSETARQLRAELTELTESERQARLLAVVQRVVAEVLGHASAASIRSGQAFTEQGFDSLTAVELRTRLTAATGLTLPATLVFDLPTPVELALHLAGRMAPEQAVSPVHAEIDRLAGTLAAHDPDEQERQRITARLQALLWRWTDGREVPDEAAADLEVDEDADIFALVDRELGVS
jgi:acyl carrier protein